MNFAGVKSITIPEGDVKRIAIGGVTVWTKPNPLPYDAEVEWVEMPRFAYVDSLFAFMPTTTFRASLGQSTFSSWANVLGTPTSAGGFYLFTNSGSIAGSLNGANQTYSGKSLQGSPIFCELVISSGQHRPVIGGTMFSGRATFASTNEENVRIGPWSGGKSDESIKCYSASISDSGILVRDFVPVRVGTVGYLYDRANPTGGPSGNGLYGSATSTPLVAGPDENGG